MAIKNLGTIRAIHIGSSAPTNTKMLWYDTTVDRHKFYNILTSQWEDLGPIIDKVSTTNADATTIFQITIADDTIVSVEFVVMGRKVNGEDRVIYKGGFLAYKNLGDNTVLQGINREFIGSDEDWDVRVEVEVGGQINLQVVGEAGIDINWKSYCQVKIL